ncbi:hypothetical protein TK5_17530 [Sideroxyarcus sp. TK5]
MANKIKTIRIPVRDDGQLRIARDPVGSIHQGSIHFAGQRGTRQTGTDALRNFGNGYRAIETALRTIR